MNYRTIRTATLALTVVCLAGIATSAQAQCSTCEAPTVAYQPVVAQPVYTGWYPGKLLDRMRLRRWDVATPEASYASANYAPYSAAYRPSTAPYTAAYAPSYNRYVTAYAPLQRRQSYYRSVTLRPIVSDSSCCGSENPCSSCCGGVAQASYDAPVSNCPSCSGGSAPVTDYSYGNGGSSRVPDLAAPNTPQPELRSKSEPRNTYYNAGASPVDHSEELEMLRKELDELRARQAETDARMQSEAYRANRPEVAPDPAGAGQSPEETTANPDAFEWYPKLIKPTADRTARGPSVNVWNAVYSRPRANASRVSSQRPTSRRPALSPRMQAEIDAQGWTAVPPRR